MKDELNLASHKRGGPIRVVYFRRRLLPALVAGCFACGPVFANPTGGQVVNGQATINTNGNVTTVVNSPGAIINWLSFSINAGQTTQFLQQNASSSVLNRIIGQNPSQIFGALESNGKVFLINPNGILFEPGSQINVGGLVASSLDISNADFIAGKNNFASSVTTPGAVVNQGSITTPNGGSIYLIAPQVQNTGILTSPGGEVLLAAGHSVQLIDGADPNIQVVISSSTDQAVNLGQVIAQGGKVGIYGALVNQGGTVNADSAVVGKNGVVVLKSSQSTILGQDSVTSATGVGTGGTVEALGPLVEIVDNALINASGQAGGGKVMVGGDFHGANLAIPDSTTVFVGADAVIKADAVQSGNGGNVAVWSNQLTEFYGNISAQGGASAGNGGFVETSSKLDLVFDGFAKLTAQSGSKGTLLLDPYTINIDTNATSGTGIVVGTAPAPVTYTGSGAPTTISDINVTTLEGQLNAGSNVLIQTSATLGTINVNSPITWSGATSLSLLATSDIAVNSPINATGGTLSLNSIVGNISQSAPITVANLAAVANSGNVLLTNGGNAVGTVAGLAGGSGGFQFINSTATVVGTVTGYSAGTSGAINGITANTGNINIQSAGAISLTQPISTSGTAYLSSSTGGISQSGSGTISAGSLYAAASATGQTVNLPLSNSITGNVAGISGGAFTLTNGPGFSTGGTIGSQTGISSSTSVTLTSSDGSIQQTGSGAITAPTVTLAAYTGIGSIGTPLNTVASTLSISNGGSEGGGDIAISNTGTLTVAGIAQTGTGGGNIVLSNTGAIDITGAISTSSGSIGIASSGAGIAVNGAISATTGNIGLTAGNGAIGIYSPISASGTVALQATGNIFQSSACGGCIPTITAGSLVAVSSGGYVNMTYSANAIGVIAGSANSTNGFTVANSTNITIGYVPSIGSSFSSLAGVNGITSTSGPLEVYNFTGNIYMAAPANGGAQNISIEPAAALIQESGGLISTTGTLTIFATNIGSSGAGNAILTDISELQIDQATNVYLSNSNTGNLALDEIRATGLVNVATAGSLSTTPAILNCDGTCFYPTNFTGTSFTFVSGGNMVLGSNNTYATTGGTGAISLYAGYTETPGSAPVTNVTASTMTLSGTLTGTPINLWANAYADFLGSANATFSTTPNYHPTSAPIQITVTGTTASNKTYDGTTKATLTGGTLQGVPTADLAYLTLTQSGLFATKNAGSGIAVTATDILNVPAALAGDFVLVQPIGLSANILQAQLTITGQVAQNKIYDGTTAATLTGGTLTGLAASDVGAIVLTQAGNFVSSAIGNNINVVATDSISGAGAANYILVQPTGLFADIVPLASLVNNPGVEQASQSYIPPLASLTTSTTIPTPPTVTNNTPTMTTGGEPGTFGGTTIATNPPTGESSDDNAPKPLPKMYCN